MMCTFRVADRDNKFFKTKNVLLNSSKMGLVESGDGTFFAMQSSYAWLVALKNSVAGFPYSGGNICSRSSKVFLRIFLMEGPA